MQNNPFATKQPAAPATPTPLPGAASSAHAQALAALAGMENAQVYGSGLKFVPGDYRLALREASFHTSQKDGQLRIIVEWEIVSCDLFADDSAEYRAGASITDFINLSKNKAVAQSRTKALLMALVPTMPEEQITAEAVATLCGPTQPAAGFRVRATCRMARNQAGQAYPQVTYRADSAEPGQEPAPAPVGVDL